MENEFIYWKHTTPIRVTVEEVFGNDRLKGKLWRDMAYQIICEHGPDGSYRNIGHYETGAPFIEGFDRAISITHTDHFLAMAYLNDRRKVEDNINDMPKEIIGIDAESLGREQVLRVREKFLNESEISVIDDKDIESNIIAWTCKEAILKAMTDSAIDYKKNIIIKTLPGLDRDVMKRGDKKFGSAIVKITNPNDEIIFLKIKLYSYLSEGYCVTIAISE